MAEATVGADTGPEGRDGGDGALERPEIVEPGDGQKPEQDDLDETIDHPAKVMRIGSMLKLLLEEVRSATLDEASRDRLREIYATSVTELGSALSPDLSDELDRLTLPFSGDDIPSKAELHVAKAQVVGWLEGLLQGMQAMLFAQQMAAQQQLQSMRARLGPGAETVAGDSVIGVAEAAIDERPGTYL